MFLFSIDDCEYSENEITTVVSSSQSIGLLYRCSLSSAHVLNCKKNSRVHTKNLNSQIEKKLQYQHVCSVSTYIAIQIITNRHVHVSYQFKSVRMYESVCEIFLHCNIFVCIQTISSVFFLRISCQCFENYFLLGCAY